MHPGLYDKDLSEADEMFARNIDWGRFPRYTSQTGNEDDDPPSLTPLGLQTDHDFGRSSPELDLELKMIQEVDLSTQTVDWRWKDDVGGDVES